MALPQLKSDPGPSIPDKAIPAASRAGSPAGVASPARMLQDQLLAQPAVAARWPVGQRIALIVAASLALWTAILHATTEIARAVA